jgi:hypothetical protein
MSSETVDTAAAAERGAAVLEVVEVCSVCCESDVPATALSRHPEVIDLCFLAFDTTVLPILVSVSPRFQKRDRYRRTSKRAIDLRGAVLYHS